MAFAEKSSGKTNDSDQSSLSIRTCRVMSEDTKVLLVLLLSRYSLRLALQQWTVQRMQTWRQATGVGRQAIRHAATSCKAAVSVAAANQAAAQRVMAGRVATSEAAPWSRIHSPHR